MKLFNLPSDSEYINQTMIKGFPRNAFNHVVSYNQFIELRQQYIRSPFDTSLRSTQGENNIIIP